MAQRRQKKRERVKTPVLASFSESLDSGPLLLPAEIITLIIAAAIVCYQLFVPPIVGLADNGDFVRILGKLSVHSRPMSYTDQYFDYLVLQYNIVPGHPFDSGFLTSGEVVGRVAFLLNRMVGDPKVFDLRAIGAVQTVLFLLGMALLARFHRLLGAVGYLYLLLLLFMLTDVYYVAFFNSAFSEPSSYIFLLLTIGALLMYFLRGRTLFLWLYLLAAILFVAAKPQNVSAGILLALYTPLLARFGPSRRVKRWIGAIAVTILLAAVYVFVHIPRYFHDLTYHTAVFLELPDSPDPAGDLRDMGLDPSLIAYSGSIPYRMPPNADPERFRALFLDRISLSTLLKFYATHPRRAWSHFERSAPGALASTATLGTFEKSVGHLPRAESQACRTWSRFRERVVPHSAAGLLLLLAFFASWLVVTWRLAPRWRPVLELAALIALIAVSQFMVVALLQGTIDTAKHMFLFKQTFDLSVIALLCGISYSGVFLVGRRRVME